MSDIGDHFRDVRLDQAAYRVEKRERFVSFDLPLLIAAGYEVVSRDEGMCYRIDARLDLYPTRRRWHNLKTGRRGGFGMETALEICQRILRETR